MLRTFHIDTDPIGLSISESEEPNTITVTVGSLSVTVTREQFTELAQLNQYSAITDCIRWVSPPEQLELSGFVGVAQSFSLSNENPPK